MVLDVSNFKNHHPGGKFLIQHNIGRDISKFFYGGYSLENFDGNSHNFKHPNFARHIVNDLIIARLENPSPKFLATIENRESLNSTTSTIFFRTTDN